MGPGLVEDEGRTLLFLSRSSRQDRDLNRLRLPGMRTSHSPSKASALSVPTFELGRVSALDRIDEVSTEAWPRQKK